MALPDQNQKAKHGFALIVVLSGLAVLTTLFAVTSTRAITHLQNVSSDVVLVEHAHLSDEILRYVMAIDFPTADADEPHELKLNGKSISIRLVDVGGLIDLNTAAPELLEKLARKMELDEAALETYHEWKDTPYQLLRVTDFLRVTRASPEHREWLLQVATVHSGRRGIAPSQAPMPVLELTTGQTGSVETLARAVPKTLRSKPTGTNYNVVAEIEGISAPVLIGTIQTGSTASQKSILWQK